MVFDVSLEMQSDSKNYVGVQDDEITEPVHTIKSACAWHLKNLRLHRQLEIFNKLLQKAYKKTKLCLLTDRLLLHFRFHYPQV